jgi:dTDP-4-amino-4,6-dideoxygalactose transaminase
MKNIDFLNYNLINKKYEKEFQSFFQKFLNKGWYVLGNEVKLFEEEYSAFSSTKFCVGVSNGLDALVLSLKALNIGHGDEVIVPSNTYIASWLAITLVGAKPVPVEPKIDTYNLNPDLILDKITESTKAVMAVNLYGQSAELFKIKKICKSCQIFLIEDNAQGQGSTCRGVLTGGIGDINATSFYPGKNLGALGDAGAVTTNNQELADKVRLLRNYGSNIKYYNKITGYNCRMDELQAGFLRIKLSSLKQENSHREDCYLKYIELLKDNKNLILPILAEFCSSVHHIFPIRLKKRDKLQEYLKLNNIGTMIHYPVPPSLQHAYKYLGFKKGDFPIAETIANEMLSLPIGPHVNLDDIEVICNKINDFFK